MLVRHTDNDIKCPSGVEHDHNQNQNSSIYFRHVWSTWDIPTDPKLEEVAAALNLDGQVTISLVAVPSKDVVQIKTKYS